MRGGVLKDLEESLLIMVHCTGLRQFWSCLKQLWCYGDLPGFGNPSAIVTSSGIFVFLSCKQSWHLVGDLGSLQP